MAAGTESAPFTALDIKGVRMHSANGPGENAPEPVEVHDCTVIIAPQTCSRSGANVTCMLNRLLVTLRFLPNAKSLSYGSRCFLRLGGLSLAFGFRLVRSR